MNEYNNESASGSLSHRQLVAVAWVVLPVILNLCINGFYVGALWRFSPVVFWLADFAQWVVLPVTLLIILARRTSILPRCYGFEPSALHWQSPIFGTILVFSTGYLCFVWTTHFASYVLGTSGGYFDFTALFPSGFLGRVIWVYSALTAGMVESIYFIGLPWLLYRNARFLPSRLAFALTMSVVFAVAHWEQGPHAMAGSFFFNLVACFWFFRLATLWPVAFGHVLVDLVLFW